MEPWFHNVLVPQAGTSRSQPSFLICKMRLLILIERISHSCPTLGDPTDCSPASSSVHGILQTRILEWVATLFSGRSSWPSDQTCISCIAGKFFTVWATNTDSMDTSLSKLLETVKDREAWHAAVHRVAKCQTRLSDWATATMLTKLAKRSFGFFCNILWKSPNGLFSQPNTSSSFPNDSMRQWIRCTMSGTESVSHTWHDRVGIFLCHWLQ